MRLCYIDKSKSSSFWQCHKKKMFRICVYIYLWWFAYVSTMYLIIPQMFAMLCVSKRSLSHVSIRIAQWNTLNWLAEAATKNQGILKWKKRYLMLRLGLTQESHTHLQRLNLWRCSRENTLHDPLKESHVLSREKVVGHCFWCCRISLTNIWHA